MSTFVIGLMPQLQALGLQVDEEVRTELGYSVDAVVLWGSCEVAVEVDGPSHFVGRTPTGATALKRRLLTQDGWRLVALPYWEWSALGRRAEAQREYLRRRLDGVVAGLEQPTRDALDPSGASGAEPADSEDGLQGVD